MTIVFLLSNVGYHFKNAKTIPFVLLIHVHVNKRSFSIFSHTLTKFLSTINYSTYQEPIQLTSIKFNIWYVC